MKIERKYIIAGLLSIISVAVAGGYLAYKKLMDYTIGLNKIRIRKISLKLISFDLFLNFTNKSTLGFDIIEQEYKVYMNNKFVSKVTNYSTTKIKPSATSLIGVNIKFDPTKVLQVIGKDFKQLILAPDQYTIKTEMNLKVKFYGFKLSIPYVYEDSLKNLIAMTKGEAV